MFKDLMDAVGCLAELILPALLTVVGLVLFAAPGVAGWFIADRFWKQGDIGAYTPYIVAFLIYGIYEYFVDLRIRAVFIRAMLAFIILLPLTYMLVLILQSVFLLFHLVQYASLQNYFLDCVLGVLIGSGVGILLTLKNTFETASEKAGKKLRELNLTDLFLEDFSLRIPVAVLIASLESAPEAMFAHIIQGVYWGITFVLVGVVYRMLIKKEPLKDFRIHILLIELLLISGMLLALIKPSSWPELPELLALFLPACAICIVIYLIILFCTFLYEHIRGFLKRETIPN